MFFNCTPEQAKSALKIAETMGGKDVTPREVVVETEQDRQALDKAKKRKGNQAMRSKLKQCKAKQ